MNILHARSRHEGNRRESITSNRHGNDRVALCKYPDENTRSLGSLGAEAETVFEREGEKENPTCPPHVVSC